MQRSKLSDNTHRPEIAVVVPTYRRPEGLRKLMDSLAKQTLPPERWEVVIVDDASGSPTAELVDEIAAAAPVQVRVLHGETNRRPAAARNYGWRSTTAPFLAFTDDDCETHPEWLAAGLATLESSSRIGVVQGRTIRPAGSEDYPYSCFTVVREVTAPSPWFEGCNLFFRRDAIEDAGGFDEVFGFYHEDTSLGWSVLEAGWERGWANEAVVEHDLSERPWWWHLQFHFLLRHTVRLAARHPAMRSMFWRPWAVTREGALFALAVLGLTVGTRRRIGFLFALPYLFWLFPPFRKPMRPRAAIFQVSVHAASFAGKLAVGAKERTLVL